MAESLKCNKTLTSVSFSCLQFKRSRRELHRGGRSEMHRNRTAGEQDSNLSKPRFKLQLIIDNNSIGVEGAMYISEALKKNKVLASLNLCKSPMLV